MRNDMDAPIAGRDKMHSPFVECMHSSHPPSMRSCNLRASSLQVLLAGSDKCMTSKVLP